MSSEVSERALRAWTEYEPETAGVQSHRVFMAQRHAFLSGWTAALSAPPIDDEVTQADRDAAAAALGYRDWADATDYRLTGAQDRQRDALVQAFHRHRIAAAGEVRRRTIEECARVDFRSVATAAMQRMRQAGESHEMCARWISEDARAAIRSLSAKEESR